jgi:predicted enzyme related to lactoylglutathione lyase
MASSFRNITVDSGDAHALARFWAAVLGWNAYFDDDPEVLVAPTFPASGAGPTMLFIPVSEPRTVKNRMHIDLSPNEGTRDEEVERLIGLGATVVEDHRTDKGGGWVWMADPEGNDFCVERSASERAGAATSRAFYLEQRE